MHGVKPSSSEAVKRPSARRAPPPPPPAALPPGFRNTGDSNLGHENVGDGNVGYHLKGDAQRSALLATQQSIVELPLGTQALRAVPPQPVCDEIDCPPAKCPPAKCPKSPPPSPPPPKPPRPPQAPEMRNITSPIAYKSPPPPPLKCPECPPPVVRAGCRGGRRGSALHGRQGKHAQQASSHARRRPRCSPNSCCAVPRALASASPAASAAAVAPSAGRLPRVPRLPRLPGLPQVPCV